jgi:Caspase domain
MGDEDHALNPTLAVVTPSDMLCGPDAGISMRVCATFLFAILAFCLASQSALAEKRVAFVVGNSIYQNVVGLTNPANDAAAITEMFKKAAFDVVEPRNDLKNAEMRRALREFTDKARDADIAVIYYAGHGIEVDGTNYLVPVDAVLERDTDAYDEAISLDRILQAIEPAKRLRLVILDACRNNPFSKKMKRTVASRALGRGLVGVEPNRPNTLIAYAAKEGSTAFDGDGKNSPFALALLKHLTTPGLDLRRALGLVRDDVMTATSNKQEPYYTGSLGGEDMALVPAPISSQNTDGNASAIARRDYELAERVGTKEAWDFFVAAYPSGFYTDLAKAQRNKLAAEAVQVAATEKARAAAEEQKRLASEGAKASEQKKAAAQSKAAEEDRLAAEKRKLAEDAKLAVAERTKAAAQTNSAEGTKKLDEEKAVSTETPAPQNDVPTGQAVASLTSTDIPRLLQSELRRVGCSTGEIDGEWNGPSRRALGLFNKSAGTKFDIKLASIDALDAVRSKTARVCPLDCERGYHATGDRCMKITCDSRSILGPDGTCRPRPERAPKVAARRAAPSAGRGKCFAFNGTRVCE